MHSITCIIQGFDPTTDTCSVELQGIGIIDAWLDGVAIAPTVDRSFIVGGMPGVVTMPDINRPCDASLIQVTPPGTPVVYDPDQIITYTGSIAIPTDLTGSGCADIVFPLPYDVVPTVSAAAAHPASVTISNLTESGFTACVTGGKVSAHHSVSYSSRSSRSGSGTPTASKNKALTVDHNLTEVGTHYILDFEDGDVVFTVESHDSPARNQVSATLSDDFKATLGGGSGSSGPGAATYYLNHNIDATASPYLVTWDQFLWGDDVYLPTNPGDIVIPADGDYHLDVQFNGSVGGGGVGALEKLTFEVDTLIYHYRPGGTDPNFYTGFDYPLIERFIRHNHYQQQNDDNYPSDDTYTASMDLPNCKAGDIIRIKIDYDISVDGSFHADAWWLAHGAADFADTYGVTPLTWVTIGPTRGGGVAAKTHRWDATDGDGVVSWTHPIGSTTQIWMPFNPAQDQAGFAVAATDPAFGGIPALLVQPGTYTISAYTTLSSITLPAEMSFELYIHNATEGFYQPSNTRYLPYDSANATNGQLLDTLAFTVSFANPFYLAASMLGSYFPTTGSHGGTTFDFEWGGLTLTLTKLP